MENDNNELRLMTSVALGKKKLNLPEGCPEDGNIILGAGNLLVISKTGDVYIKGRLVGNDSEIMNGFRDMLKLS